MKTCAFFGARTGEYKQYEQTLTRIIVELIEKHNVLQFFSGGRGAFDELASHIVGELRKDYPQIKNTKVLSYMPTDKEKFVLPEKYTDTVYLLERYVPPRYAIIETNKRIIEKADVIIFAAKYSVGGARTAREYAQKQNKQIIDIEEMTEAEKRTE